MLGDLHVTVFQVTSLEPADKGTPAQFTYELMFTDIPTGKTERIVAEGEQDAIMLFAAWLTVDEPGVSLSPYCARLYSMIADKGKFLP